MTADRNDRRTALLGAMSRSDRRRAILVLALSPGQDPGLTAARVGELAAETPDAMVHWSQLCLLFDRAGLDPDRTIAAAAAAGPLLERLVPEPPAPPLFEVSANPETVPLYRRQAAQ
ncbi:hypothetical protein BBK14_02010 [Parafrankia soli]|uniref:Uncharacterized protein n=1 Tax=Parafrankia soli TaxID=2599596 RepID=A0A1S1RKN3_9ACTN|nr:hypothetical protein [Parafrankia soli]OHV46646.1 hypothetical protein BBK14_02010 [Parafrankia soli]